MKRDEVRKTIALSVRTYNRLKKLGTFGDDTFDDIVSRLLDLHGWVEKVDGKK